MISFSTRRRLHGPRGQTPASSQPTALLGGFGLLAPARPRALPALGPPVPVRTPTRSPDTWRLLASPTPMREVVLGPCGGAHADEGLLPPGPKGPQSMLCGPHPRRGSTRAVPSACNTAPLHLADCRSSCKLISHVLQGRLPHTKLHSAAPLAPVVCTPNMCVHGHVCRQHGASSPDRPGC